ncbi:MULTISPECIES: integration host factor subunit alpha [unclassified Novosphingobium]|uniref:integration host factor subunit alpha n=1 Tax=unclassified Novosphingobium TaxID=2644732 RepID=UPI001358BB26|nr:MULTISPECIES: integration host factor subunit alpha [unclassified Novosphingobium]
MRRDQTLTRAAIAEAIQREVGLNNREALEMVCSILEHMCSAMARGENMKISGFGSFLLRDKSERIGRNPKTGDEHAIEPRRVMTFRASAKLKQRIVRADQEEAAAAVTEPRRRASQG